MSDWSSGPNVNPDKALKRSTTPRTVKVKFGDGYSQRMADGINILGDKWDLEFKNRDIVTIESIRTFLEQKKGTTGFTWTPPGFVAATTKTVSSAANSGSGVIRITSSTAHGFKSNMQVVISGCNGTVPANGNWYITVITSTTFDLIGSAFSGSGTTSGTITVNDPKFICEKWDSEILYTQSDLITGVGSLSCTLERVYE